MQSILIKLIIVGLASLASSAISLYFLIPFLSKKAFVDIPNARSSHTKVTPRGGGLGIVIGILTGSIVAFFLKLPLPHFTFFIGLLLMSVTSFIDDKKSLPVGIRLSAHILAMGIVIFYTGGLKRLPFPAPLDFELGWLGFIISGIWIVSVINFYNFLDGIDGFAGTQAFLAGLAIVKILWMDNVFVIGISITMAALGFLFYNWHPARIFMGDVGSVSLGFIFATLPFYNQSISIEEGVFSVAMFLWFFLADGAFTLTRRAINKEKIWQPHRTHLYQRLNKAGWKHNSIVVMVMALATIVILIQIYFVLQHKSLNWWSVLLGIFMFSIYLTIVFIKEKNIETTNLNSNKT